MKIDWDQFGATIAKSAQRYGVEPTEFLRLCGEYQDLLGNAPPTVQPNRSDPECFRFACRAAADFCHLLVEVTSAGYPEDRWREYLDKRVAVHTGN